MVQEEFTVFITNGSIHFNMKEECYSELYQISLGRMYTLSQSYTTCRIKGLDAKSVCTVNHVHLLTCNFYLMHGKH